MNLHLHLAGKTGEVVFFSGTFPAIRQRWPGARLLLHLHPHYVPVVDGLEHKPDEVITETPDTNLPLNMQVHKIESEARRGNGLMPMALRLDGTWHVIPYGLHQYRGAFPGCPPFYVLFQRAADADAFPYVRPMWRSRDERRQRPCAVVFPGSADAGAFTTMDLPPETWEELASGVRRQGLEPMATGWRGDKRPTMPGWTWLETDNVVDVLRLLESAERVVGLNSGIVFAACLISPGRVTMIDGQVNLSTMNTSPLYSFDAMRADGVLDLRHTQVIWLPNRERIAEVARAALL